jgi:acyl-CoA synthetase (NDP forming)/alkylation response protein AidB-like acyl-CoA dehydrogenase
MGALVTPDRLREFFAPRSLAVVGASDTSGWGQFILASSAATGFTGPLIPVHPRHETVFGRPAARSLRDLAEPVDLAFVMAPTQVVEDVIDDAAAAGVRNAVVLASGYREVGAEGHARQDRLVARATEHGIVLLGPNCLGFLNTHAAVGPFALNVPLPLRPGPVGIALQSGALASAVLAFARSRAIGVSTLVTMGNESMITTADVLSYLVDDEQTRVICLFLEEISEPDRFARAAEKAARAGKPVVALKTGSSPVGQVAALAHTGSIAGDDAVVDAVLRQFHVIRVTSIEELLGTAGLLGYDRWPRGRRMGVLTASGGACGIIADRAGAQGIEIPPFAARTVAAVKPHLPPFAAAHNPLDVTGYVLANARATALTAIDHALDAAVADPGLDFVVFCGVTIPDVRPPSERLAAMIEERVRWLGERIASAPIPVIPMGSTCVDVSGYGRDLLTRHGIHLLGGFDLGMRALGHALRWLENRGTVAYPARVSVPRQVPVPRAPGSWPEMAARDLLAASQVPLVPAELVNSPAEAVQAARRIGAPVVLKVSSTQITHKSDIGGVALGVHGDAQIEQAYGRVRAAGERVPGAVIDGVLVTPMRSGGVELLAGVTLDRTFGPVLAVGLGGVWVELLADTSLRVLPVTTDDVKRMLGELRGSPLLRGARGTGPADLDVLAQVIKNVGDAAMSLDGSLRALEINPLWVNGDRVEALDVLVVTGPPAPTSPERSLAMNLGITAEQRDLRESVRRFLAERAPMTRVRELMETADTTDAGVWRQAGVQLGLQAIAIPEEYGGAGFSFAEQAVVLEELGGALYGGPYLASAVLAATALLASEDEGARRDLLPGIASGQTVATLAFTEDDGSWDPESIRLAAAKNGPGWRLDGHKSFVLDGNAANLILAVAATDHGPSSLSLFAVDGTAKGLSRRALPTLDQTRRLARLEFSDVPGRLIGSPGAGKAALDHTLDVAAVALAAEQLGGAQRALDMAVEYAKIRRQFGRPIGSFQAIKHRCADLLLEVESLRSAVGYAAAAVAEGSTEVPVLAALVKAYASEVYSHVAGENIQIHGGIGFTWEHDAHLYLKRAKASELFLGDASYHRERLATRIGL